MTRRESGSFAVTSKSVAGLAIVFLVLAAFFGFLNIQKVKALRSNAANAQVGRNEAVRSHAQVQKENADLQARLDASQQEVASLQKRTEEAKNANGPVTGSPAEGAQTADLRSQVDDLRRQLDSAEKEKAFLAEKIQGTQEHGAQPKEGKKRRETVSVPRESVAPRRTGVHGTVLAYNQAYNFVVLNLGARNGVETNSEMIVLREGTLIGKIRISSVEPATAIGDIITNSLARGVQVQPGDTVIYAGTSP